ncbi:hypothetical protein NLI96_g4400 [Meripilus lineatus]|uniref:F-box domain-containing protein n=1 Tax=Meripilus lineatus TaxID=2056292 RepID=A0AAD5YI35_9APHY|nr:hypothetical protein NLI96_g4400 [Physisporinus lineatus]
MGSVSVQREPGSPVLFTKTTPPVQAHATFKPAMGLPIELWYHIISFLPRDPSALRSCSQTCRVLRRPALLMIRNLISYFIDPATYDDVNYLVREIHDMPTMSGCVRRFMIQPNLSSTETTTSPTSPPVALSVIPHLLARKVSRLSVLEISTNLLSPTHLHASSWTLYGRSFTGITWIKLNAIVFPSFRDFASLISSFPSLSVLLLNNLSISNKVIPLSISRCPRKRDLKLRHLEIYNFATLDGDWFSTAFIAWFLRKGGQVSRMLAVDSSVLGSPAGDLLLLSVREPLQSLRMDLPMTPKPRSLKNQRELIGCVGEQTELVLYLMLVVDDVGKISQMPSVEDFPRFSKS